MLAVVICEPTQLLGKRGRLKCRYSVTVGGRDAPAARQVAPHSLLAAPHGHVQLVTRHSATGCRGHCPRVLQEVANLQELFHSDVDLFDVRRVPVGRIQVRW